MKKALLIFTASILLAAYPAFGATFATINVDGDASEWTSIPVALTDATGDASVLDITTIKLANDNDYLYILANFASSVNPNDSLSAGTRSLYIALDNDSSAATGFDIFSLGLVGSEAGWQNDFPFAQAAGNFNSGSINNGAAGIALFNTATTLQEIRISRAATFATGGASIFPNDSFNVGFYTQGNGTTDEFAGPAAYTFAIPEPGTLAFLIPAMGIFLLAFRRRK